MVCARMRVMAPGGPGTEWTPAGLRETVCLLRKSSPLRWRDALASAGYEIEPGDVSCLRNLDGRWDRCPFYRARPGPGGRAARARGDRPRNEFGYPLQL